MRHRLRVAGASGEIFTPAALARSASRVRSGFRASSMSAATARCSAPIPQETRKVTPALVRRAAGEVYGRRFAPPWLGLGHARRAGRGALRERARGTVPLAPSAAGAVAARFSPLARRHDPCPHSRRGAPHRAGLRRAPAACSGETRRRPAPPVEPPPSINALLAANGANTSDAAAFRRLLALWGTAMADDRDPCGQAQKAGLACLDQRGSWAQVRALNRPAILTLTDDRGARHRVVLSALDERSATLDLGEHDVRVPLDELSRDWFGEFTVVWKPKTSRTRLLVARHARR